MIWMARNELVFKKTKCNPSSIAFRVVSYLYDSLSIDQPEGVSRERCTIQVKWTRPDEGGTKQNVDGAF